MSRPPALVGGGAATIDDVVFVQGKLGDGKGRIISTERHFGGNVATALIAAARTGVSCAFLGHLPDDSTEPEMLDHLRAEGVDLSQAKMSSTTRAIRATVLVAQNGERFIAFNDHETVGLPDDLDLDLVRSARVLILDGYGLPGGIRAARAARESGVAVIADIERATDASAEKLFALADHLILPVQMALEWTGTNTAAKAVDALWRPDRSAVVITVGAEGCYYRAANDGPDGTVQHQTAPQVTVVDTTGCGDVFHGVYAAWLTRGETVPRCIAEATTAAADCATHSGGIAPRVSSPTIGSGP